MSYGDEPRDTRPQADAVERSDADELRARAQRIRERSEELVAVLGEDHPLVAEARERATYLEAEAAQPGHIHLH